MNRWLTYLFVLTAATFAGCGGGRDGRGTANPYAEIAARVAAQATPDAVLAETRRALDSLAAASPESLRPTVQAICRALVDAGRKTEAASVAALACGIDGGENPEIASRLLTSILLPGTKAPPIAGLLPAREKPKFTVVLFHESACRTCGTIVWELKQRYAELQMAGVRVVTVSTDTDAQVWTEYAAGLPWPDKLCDYRGFYSPAMTAYGVAATPTLFLIDREGVVTDQYGTPEELWSVIFKK